MRRARRRSSRASPAASPGARNGTITRSGRSGSTSSIPARCCRSRCRPSICNGCSASTDRAAALKKLEGFRLDGIVQKMTCPFLLLHGGGDEQIPLALAEKCFAAVGSKQKTFKVFHARGRRLPSLPGRQRHHRRALHVGLDRRRCNGDSSGGLKTNAPRTLRTRWTQITALPHRSRRGAASSPSRTRSRRSKSCSRPGGARAPATCRASARAFPTAPSTIWARPIAPRTFSGSRLMPAARAPRMATWCSIRPPTIRSRR